MKKIKLKLVAGVAVNVAMVGDFFLLKESSVDIKLSISELNIDTSFSVGMSVKFDSRFSEVTILSEVDQLIEIVIAVGEVSDNSLTGEVSIKQGGVLSVRKIIVGGSIINLINSDSSRKLFRIINQGPAPLRIYGASDSSNDTYILYVGDIYEEVVCAGASVRAKQNSPGSCDVKIVEGY